MNVLSSYLWSPRSWLPVCTTRAKPQLANANLFVLSGCASCRVLLLNNPKRSCRFIVNKPPLVSLKAICGQWSYRDVCHHAAGRHITKFNAMTLSRRARREHSRTLTSIPAAGYRAATRALSLHSSPRSLNCRMRMNVDNI